MFDPNPRTPLARWRATAAVATLALMLAACGGDADAPAFAGGPSESTPGTPGTPGADAPETPTITMAAPSYVLEMGAPFKATPSLNMAASGWSIEPALPVGLSFDAASGEIAGMTHGAMPDTRYTLSAQTAAGTALTEISLRSVGTSVPAGEDLISASLEHDGVWWGVSRNPSTLYYEDLGNALFVDPATGRVSRSSPQPFVVDWAEFAFPDPQRPGGFFVTTRSKAGSTGTMIIRIGPDGSRDPEWPIPAVDQLITALAVKGDQLLIAGRFGRLEVDGVEHTRRDFAAVGLADGQPTQWAPQHTNAPGSRTTYDMAVDGDTVYLTGWYGQINGVDCSAHPCAVRGVAGEETTNWRPTIGGDGAFVNYMAVDGERVLLIGRFSSVNGEPVSNPIAAVDKTTGAMIAAFEASPTFSATERSVAKPAIHDGRLIVPLADRLVAFDVQTGAQQWSSPDFTAGPQNAVRGIAAIGEHVVACHGAPGMLAMLAVADGTLTQGGGEGFPPDGCGSVFASHDRFLILTPVLESRPFHGEPLNAGSPGFIALDSNHDALPLIVSTLNSPASEPHDLRLATDGTHLVANPGSLLRVIDMRSGTEVMDLIPIFGNFDNLIVSAGKVYLHGEIDRGSDLVETAGRDTLLELDILTGTVREFIKTESAEQQIRSVALRDGVLHVTGEFDAIRIGEAEPIATESNSIAVDLATGEPRAWSLSGFDVSGCRSMHWAGGRIVAVCRSNPGMEFIVVFDEQGQRVTNVAEFMMAAHHRHEPRIHGDTAMVYLRSGAEAVIDPIDGRLDGPGLALLDLTSGQGRLVPRTAMPVYDHGAMQEIAVHRWGERLLMHADADGESFLSGSASIETLLEAAGPRR